MHDFNRFDDVEATPVAAPECIRAGHTSDKLTKTNVSVFKASFR